MTDAHVTIIISVQGLREMTLSFDELSKPPGFKAIGRLEKTLAETFVAVKSHVHVLTGGLLASGVTVTDYDGGTWSAEIDFDADPGIFELARGNTPTLNHPEGGHFFFDAVDPFLDKFEEDIDAYFADAFGVLE